LVSLFLSFGRFLEVCGGWARTSCETVDPVKKIRSDINAVLLAKLGCQTRNSLVNVAIYGIRIFFTRIFLPEWPSGMKIMEACILASRLRPGNRLHGDRGMTRNMLPAMILLVMMLATVHGYCGDGVCELGMEDGSWCDDCKCGDSMCDFREQAFQWCPNECSSVMSISRQPNSSTIAGVPLSVQPSVQIFARAGIPSSTSAQVNNSTMSNDAAFVSVFISAQACYSTVREIQRLFFDHSIFCVCIQKLDTKHVQ
jgi:hypothetical protein